MPVTPNSEGVTTVWELVLRSANELLQVSNFDETLVQEVRQRLRLFGLKLWGD
jgi:DNA-directed RNA polymerase alpha subunit